MEPKLETLVRRTLARDRLLTAGVVCAGVLLSLVAMHLAWSYRGATLRRQLAEVARGIENRLVQQVGAVDAFVETVASFVESSEEVRRSEFVSFLGRTAERWPGLRSVEWQARIQGADRAAFEARMRAQGLEGFGIIELDGSGRAVKAAERDDYLALVHVFTVEGHPPPVGLDLAARDAALPSAEGPGVQRAVASGPVPVAPSTAGEDGRAFVVRNAVRRAGSERDDTRIRGVVSATFAYQPLIAAALQGIRIEHVGVTVKDAGTEVVVFQQLLHPGERPVKLLAGMSVQSTLPVLGRDWLITIVPEKDLFTGIILVLPWYVLGTGLALTLAAGVVLNWRQRVRGEQDARGVERVAVEKRFHDIVDRMSGGVLLLRGDRDGTRFQIVDVNAAAGALIGREGREVVGSDFSLAIPEAGRAGLLAGLQRAWRSGEVDRLDALALNLGGRVRHLNCVFFRVGQAEEICAVLQDLTELKVVEGALREARDELELALDVSRVGLWSWDPELRRLRLDARCASLHGLEGAGLVDEERVTSRIHPEDLRLMRDEIARALAEDRSYEVEFRYTLPDGTLRHLCSRARPMREDGSTAAKVVGCSWDVTERRRMEEHLRRSQRIESLGTLAGGVAHDLNNALAPVTMGLDLLKRRLGDDPDGLESIKLMQTSVRRASSIVRQLIAFKRGAGESKMPQTPAHPKRVLELLATTLVESFPKEIAVQIEPVSLDLPRVVADEREVHQILLNLCVNARDAMPQGGRLVVACEPLEIDVANRSKFPELRPGHFVLFRVSDTGHGVPVDIRHRVFDPFFTTKEVGKGSGLGLSTALGIAKAHRGGIQFETREGGGSTFSVLIPTVPDDEPNKTIPIVSIAASVAGSSRPPSVLLVDDEPQVRELARRALEQAGYRIRTAGNGREAVEVFSSDPDGIDTVVMDLLMPVMNGATATAAIKRLRPDVPIVGASGFATDALVDQAKNAGITTFLPKPFTVAALVEAVRHAIATRSQET